MKYFGSPCVKHILSVGTVIQVVTGEDAARLQLSQWQ